MESSIRRATHEDKVEWLKMRKGVWPEAAADYLDFDMGDILDSKNDAVFLAFVDSQPIGMIEVSLREYADGCDTSPVGYVEAWFVYEKFRGSGIGGDLLRAAEDWARAMGCTEMGSDTWWDNEKGIHAHLKHGYVEAERLVHFVKSL